MTEEPPKTTLADGSPVTPDHRELKPNGQQKGYVVLSEDGTEDKLSRRWS